MRVMTPAMWIPNRRSTPRKRLLNFQIIVNLNVLETITSGHRAIGTIRPPDITGFPARGWLRLTWARFGRRLTGVSREADTGCIADTGRRILVSTAASTTVLDTRAAGTTADIGTTDNLITTVP
jgi:hypothetical protein